MNELGEQLKRWTDHTTAYVKKWVSGMDSMLGQALAEWVAQEKRVIAFQKRTKEVEAKLKRHDQVIQDLITRLYEQKDSSRIDQQSHFQQEIREKAARIETLHRQLQEKEKVVVKSRLAIQQLMFKVNESKSTEDHLKVEIHTQKEQLTQFDREKQWLQSQINRLQNDLAHSTLETYAKQHLEMQVREATERIREIEMREHDIREKNATYKIKIQQLQQDRQVLNEHINQMEHVRDALANEKHRLLQSLSAQEQQMRVVMTESEKLQEQLSISQREGAEAYALWTTELNERAITENEKDVIQREYDQLIKEWETEKKKFEQKESRLEKRLGRRIGGSIPHILVEPEFEKDYLELSEDERTGVDAALYELSLGWHTGNVHFRPNHVKGKTTSFSEYAWGSSHRIPGRLYVKKEAEGYRIYRISRLKDGSHRLSQTRVIAWLKNR